MYQITTCSVFVRRSNYVPDYYAKDIVGNEWIVFFNNSSYLICQQKLVDIHQQLFFTSNHFYIDFILFLVILKRMRDKRENLIDGGLSKTDKLLERFPIQNTEREVEKQSIVIQ